MEFVTHDDINVTWEIEHRCGGSMLEMIVTNEYLAGGQVVTIDKTSVLLKGGKLVIFTGETRPSIPLEAMIEFLERTNGTD